MRELLLWVATLLCLMTSASCQTTNTTTNTTTSCICDLIPRLCEIGCCCDLDCTEQDVAVFSACKDVQYSTVYQRCTSIYIVRVNNAFGNTLTFENNQSCVTAYNALSENRYKQADCISQGNCALSLPAVPISDAFNESDLMATRNDSTFYKSGNPIVTITISNNITGVFAMPSSSSFSSFCRDNIPVRYLHDTSHSCIVYMESLSQCNDITLLKSTHFTYSSVLSDLKFLDEFYAADEGVINVTKNCIDELTGAETSCDVLPAYNATSDECVNAVKSVSVQFETNGTSGIATVSCTLVIGTINQTNFPFSSTFDVSFVSVITDTSTPVDGLEFTSNYGYIDGAPIQTSENYFLSLTGVSTDNTCTSTNRLPISFKHNARTSCMATYNRTELCSDLQSRFVAYLRGATFPANRTLLVPINRNPEDSLISAFVDNDPATDALNIVANGCSNIAVAAKYTILYKRSGTVGNSQLFLSAISFEYTTRSFKFTCLGRNCKTGQSSFELMTSVEYVDISESVTDKVVPNTHKYYSFFWPIYLSIETTVHEIMFYPHRSQATDNVGSNLSYALLIAGLFILIVIIVASVSE